MKEVVVPPGKVFVMGDNRSMPIAEHKGGLIATYRIKGRPWINHGAIPYPEIKK